MKNKRIVLFTSNREGAMVQFTVAIYHHLVNLGFETFVFIPGDKDTITKKYKNLDIIPFTFESNTSLRDEIKSLLYINPKYSKIADCILELHPDLVWFTDNPLRTLEIGMLLNSKVDCMLTLHDAGSVHPGRYSFKERLIKFKAKQMSNKIEKQVKNILLLSPNSVNLYRRNKPKLTGKIRYMPLCPHIPDDEEIRPKEIIQDVEYYLFFGRIDKYKGLATLFRTYCEYSKMRIYPKLIVAGKGTFSQEEQDLLSISDAVIINRFIDDGEMKWLIHNANAVVLPYIEATQSGIIPISYEYGVPVIVSNVEGLTQFVDDTNTGFVCTSDEDYINAYIALNNNEVRERMSKNAFSYAKCNFDWESNLQSLMNEVFM